MEGGAVVGTGCGGRPGTSPARRARLCTFHTRRGEPLSGQVRGPSLIPDWNVGGQ